MYYNGVKDITHLHCLIRIEHVMLNQLESCPRKYARKAWLELGRGKFTRLQENAQKLNKFWDFKILH